MLVTALIYGFGTLTALWAFGGGETAVFWQRQGILAGVLWILGIAGVRLLKRQRLFSMHKGSVMIGVGSAIVTALPVLAIVWVGKHTSFQSLPFIETALEAFHPSGFSAILIGAFLLSPAHEMVSRGVLMTQMGLSGIAFLDALAIGFGFQMFVPFLLYWAMGVFWGYLSRQFGVLAAVISHTLWSLVVLSALAFL